MSARRAADLRRIRSAPALRALLIQLGAFLPTLAAVWLLAYAGCAPGYPSAALLQGVFAAAISRWRRLAPWWLAIQLVFPPALLGAATLHVPPLLSLAVFGFLVLLYWSTFRTQVPYYPSGRAVRAAVAALLAPDRPARAIDIGSGLGGLVLALAQRRPDCRITGIELAPLPWMVSWLRAKVTSSYANFILGDYEALDFAQFDLVFAYLSPAAMPALWRKCIAEMKSGSCLISYEFIIVEREPSLVIPLTQSERKLYVWHF